MSIETERTCKKCGITQPIEEYYELRTGKNGRSGHCRICNNKRPPTETRTIAQRARNRASQALIERHRDEFEELRVLHLAQAKEELEQLRAAAAQKRADDIELPRLKPGPKRHTDSNVIDRLDVARCPHCHEHHDRGHQCPACGELPLEVVDPGLDIDYVAIERRMAGDRSIRLNKLEREELVALWRRSGRPMAQMERSTGLNATRYPVQAEGQSA